MAKTLPGEPNLDYDFGQEFDYSLWVPGTTIDLVNVPWNNDYRDVVRFNDRSDLDKYINSLEVSGTKVTHLSYVKPNEPIRINIPHNRVNRFNYLRASNPLQPITGDIQKNYYYFILDTKYVAPNTTEIILQLDVWQTYIYDATLGNCYVERGHIGIANENNFSSYGRDYLTVPEGLNTGGEYRVVGKQQRRVMNISKMNEHAVIALSTVALNVNYGDVNNPVLKASGGTSIQGVPSGMESWMWSSVAYFREWVGSMKDYPWIMQGIVSIVILPHPSRYDPGWTSPPAGDTMHNGVATSYPAKSINYPLYTNWRQEVTNIIPPRYRSLKKFLTYPYLAIELTTWTGSPVVLKPESWADDNATIMERITVIPPNQKLVFTPRHYNSWGNFQIENNGQGDDAGEYLDLTVNIQNFPTLPIVNSGALQYMASNANSFAYQRQSADWSQNRALHAAQTGYDQASSGMALTSDVGSISQALANAQALNANNTLAGQARVSGVGDIVGGGINGAGYGGGATGALTGVASGGVNAIAGAMNASIQMGANNQDAANRNAATRAGVSAQNANQGYLRDTNKQLADWAAKGDYANQIAGINAKIQDAQMIQPNVSSQFGGETLNMVYNEVGVFGRWKMIDAANIAMIGEYWLRFGYAVQRFLNIPSDFRVMTKFTYWKMSQTYINSGPMPEAFKQALRGIFEKGVTVWINPADIGNVDNASNQPIPGIFY